MDEYIDDLLLKYDLLQELELWIENPELLGQVDPDEYWDQDPGVSLEL